MMTQKDCKKALWLMTILILFPLAILSTLNGTTSCVRAASSTQMSHSLPGESHPLIVYYSRSGKTRMVAKALMDQLSCESEEIKSKVNRTGLGIINCFLDQLLERDDQLEPLQKKLKDYNPIIIASPIWIGQISSPAMTFIKQTDLQGTEVYVFLTYNGSMSQEKETILRKNLSSRGVKLKGIYKIITKDKNESDITQEVSKQLRAKPIAHKKTSGLSPEEIVKGQ